jgi:hypothetical protein
MNDFGWDLPPGCTDSDCEPNDPSCGNCGHQWSEHYHDEDEITQPCERDVIGYDSSGRERDSQGNITLACDIKHCVCTEFGDFEYEPYDERI